MGSIKGFIDWVKGEDVEDDYEEELPRQRNEEPVKSSAPSSYERSYERSYDRSYDSASTEASSPRRGNKVVNINTTTQLAVVLVKPDRFENAAEIADHLKDKRTVVLNLEQTNKDIARRLVDFLSGVAYANEGKIKKVANSTYIITPYNVDIMGDLIDELESSGMYF
ncbi:cell division protein SepF [Candidatus Agathobaculum pullicola]|uniref:cell division protein SepF n=1 Tax=Candidatus Agathobaculum pullicola TaxID=2838426 RepID=UPI0026741B58|nr:cell division protein SepF [uncultured Agathobaculum sp.]